MTEVTQTAPPEPANTASFADPIRTTESNNAAAQSPAAAFDLGEEIGRGGMGVVYRARDLGLDREVAIKLLQEKYAPGSGTAVRFYEEARITGQLQHPGIPAVYQVGTWGDGRPFLAMKLIKGRTLDELLKAQGPSPTRWLGPFEQVCHAVGYAHDHGVIHRDLKPANVMVGAFGEVQVMDWGLAKVLAGGRGRPNAAEEVTPATTEVRSFRDSEGSFTQAGSVLGTPAYMPPEQAAGELDKVDQRADVFGLGAILCTLLTGKPPYEGSGAESIRAAVRGQTAEAVRRLGECGADPELVALCTRCLAFEPAGRPANAAAVAAGIADLRKAADERAAQADRDRLAAEVRLAEQSRRRRVLVWSGVAIIAVLSAGVAVSLWQAERAKRAEASATRQLAETQKAEAAARAISDELEATIMVISDATLREGQEKQSLEFYQRLVPVRRRVAAERPSDLRAQLDLADGLRRLAYAHRGLDQHQQALDALVEELALTESLATADPTNSALQQRLGDSYCNVGDLKMHLFEAKTEAKAYYLRAVNILGRLAATSPTTVEYLASHHSSVGQLAESLHQLGETKEAREQFRACVAIAMKIHELNPKAADVTLLGRSYHNLGVVTRKLGEVREARECFRQGLASDERAAKADPQTANWSYWDRNITRYHQNIASTSLELGDLPAATDSYREVVKIDRRALDGNPNDTEAKRVLVLDLQELGEVVEMTGDDKAAAEHFEQALAVAAKLERPEQFAIDVSLLRQQLASCRARIATPGLPELAPPPRPRPESQDPE